MNSRLKNENKGFTLVEVIITVAILALVVAPFLSSFLVAGNTNASAKRKQEATDLGQLLAEEFDAKDINMILSEGQYGTPERFEVEDEDTGEMANGYKFNIGSDYLPASYSNSFRAVVTLQPSKHDINNVGTPVVNGSSTDNMAVYMSNIYSADSKVGSDASYRECTLTIRSNYNEDMELVYYVKMSVRYYSSSGSMVYSADNQFSELSYTNKIPEIYIFYLPFGEQDRIVIDNQIPIDDLTDGETGEVKYTGIHVITQDIASSQLDPSDITVISLNEANISEEYSLEDLQGSAISTGEMECVTATTKIYTNVRSDYATDSFITGYVEKDTLYNLKVEVYFGDKRLAVIDTDKNIPYIEEEVEE